MLRTIVTYHVTWFCCNWLSKLLIKLASRIERGGAVNLTKRSSFQPDTRITLTIQWLMMSSLVCIKLSIDLFTKANIIFIYIYILLYLDLCNGKAFVQFDSLIQMHSITMGCRHVSWAGQSFPHLITLQYAAHARCQLPWKRVRRLVGIAFFGEQFWRPRKKHSWFLHVFYKMLAYLFIRCFFKIKLLVIIEVIYFFKRTYTDSSFGKLSPESFSTLRVDDVLIATDPRVVSWRGRDFHPKDGDLYEKEMAHIHFI